MIFPTLLWEQMWYAMAFNIKDMWLGEDFMGNVDLQYISIVNHQMIRQSIESSMRMAFEQRNSNMKLGNAIHRARKIAKASFEEYKKSFSDRFHTPGRNLEALYYPQGDMALFHINHLKLLEGILQGKIDPEPKESIPPSQLPDRA